MSSSVTSIATFQKRVKEMLPSLSQAEAEVLGLLSYGIVILDKCGLTKLSHGLAKIEQVPAERLRQRLREFYYEAEAKRGKKRREVNVQHCFPELLRSILRGWEGKKELALSMDATLHPACDIAYWPRLARWMRHNHHQLLFQLSFAHRTARRTLHDLHRRFQPTKRLQFDWS